MERGVSKEISSAVSSSNFPVYISFAIDLMLVHLFLMLFDIGINLVSRLVLIDPRREGALCCLGREYSIKMVKRKRIDYLLVTICIEG